MKEIERKFLVKDISKLNLEMYESKEIIQDYLYSDCFTAIRKRKIIKNKNEKYIYTVKTNKSSGYGLEEIEKEISKEDYDKLKKLDDRTTIDKIRYNIPIENNLIIELDIFKGEYEGIIFAEIEFPSEEMASSYTFPQWFDKELSGKITNNMMTILNPNEVFEKIKNIK